MPRAPVPLLCDTLSDGWGCSAAGVGAGNTGVDKKLGTGGRPCPIEKFNPCGRGAMGESATRSCTVSSFALLARVAPVASALGSTIRGAGLATITSFRHLNVSTAVSARRCKYPAIPRRRVGCGWKYGVPAGRADDGRVFHKLISGPGIARTCCEET